MKQAKFLFLLIAALAFASCGSDEPRYADQEAQEKTEGLDQNLTQDDTPGDSWNEAMGREFDFDSDF